MTNLSAVAARPLNLAAISASDLARVQSASDRDHIGSAARRVWDKVADFFCSTDRAEAKKCLYDLYAPTTPDARKIELFTQLREMAGAGVQDRFQHRVENGRESFALLLDGHDVDGNGAVILTRRQINCDHQRLERVMASDRSAEHLDLQIAKDITRSTYIVGGQPLADDPTLDKEDRVKFRLQALDQQLAALDCTPEQVRAVHALANQSTLGLAMQSTLAPDPAHQPGWITPLCPSSADQYTAYSISRENGELQVQSVCLQDIATLRDEEKREEMMSMCAELEHVYQSLEIRVAIHIDPAGMARVASLDYLGNKGLEAP